VYTHDLKVYTMYCCIECSPHSLFVQQTRCLFYHSGIRKSSNAVHWNVRVMLFVWNTSWNHIIGIFWSNVIHIFFIRNS